MYLPIAILGSCLPQLLSIFLGVLFLSSFEANTALASPQYGHFSTWARILARDESDYPSDTDIANNCKVDADKSVFFSQTGNSTPAYNFAKENGKVIFRGAFLPNYTTKNGAAPINGTKTSATASPESSPRSPSEPSILSPLGIRKLTPAESGSGSSTSHS